MEKIAIVIGASGLVGIEIVKQLLLDSDYTLVKLFLRKEIPFTHSKLQQCIVDFNKLDTSSDLIKGDVVFCCMGTTIKVAGSQDAFVKVDYSYVLNFAQLSKRNGIEKFIVVSSLGADKNSSNFYLKVKGDVETDLARLKFKNLIIVRPSMLLGDRKEFRLGELIGKKIMKGLAFLFVVKLKKYKAIEASTVAKAMLVLSKNELSDVAIFENARLLDLGK
ncbi:MAG: oxidoreductase [Bacteroidetes bacterium]|nr:oxidoreductase [Bacteroidota bacterium]